MAMEPGLEPRTSAPEPTLVSPHGPAFAKTLGGVGGGSVITGGCPATQ